MVRRHALTRWWQGRLPQRPADAQPTLAQILEILQDTSLGLGMTWDGHVVVTTVSGGVAVWAGDRILVWSGGTDVAAYEPGSDSWAVLAGGVAEGQQQLDIGFYTSRWERATKAEREFLRAMAPDDGAPSKIADVTERLGRTDSRSVGPARASLIGKGIVYSPQHGMIAYSVPGMADYVRRRDDE